MKLSYFSVHVGFDGTLSGVINFSGIPTSVIHSLTPVQASQLATLIEQWRVQLLDEAAAKLIQARDDTLALTHEPSKTDSEDSTFF